MWAPEQQGGEQAQRPGGRRGAAGKCGGLGAGQGVQPEVCVLMLRAMVYGLARMQADGQLQEWLPPGMTEQAAQNQSLQGLIALLSAYDSGHEQQAF